MDLDTKREVYMADKIKTVRAKCDSCGGTGLYSGMCEGEGNAVVCLGCAGTGGMMIRYEPFVDRKGRRDIETVILGRATRSILEASVGKTIPYKEWWKRTGGRSGNSSPGFEG